MRDESWDTLVQRTARGELGAFTELYDGTVATVLGLVLRVVGDRGVAEEVAGDVYLQVWREAGRFDPSRGGALTWLLMLARSRAVDRLRAGLTSRTRTAPLEEAATAEDPGPPPDEAVAVQARRRRVQAALASLSPEQRATVELAYFGGLSHSEIATRLALPLGTVKTRIRLGMTRLREALAGAAGELP